MYYCSIYTQYIIYWDGNNMWLSKNVTKMCDKLFPAFEFPKLALVSFLIIVTDF